MKKNLIIILLFFLFVRVGDINAKENLPELGKDYGFLGLNDNVVNYQWKIDSVRKTIINAKIYFINFNFSFVSNQF
jgi:hypothetical protein